MATAREIAFYNADGTPKTDAVPAFGIYRERDGTVRTPPSFTQLASSNVWSFLPTDTDEAAGVAYTISGGAGAFPARHFGSVHLPSLPFATFLLEDAAGALWAGAAPTLPVYKQLDNSAASAPTVTAVGALAYLFTITPTLAQLTAGGVGYRLAAPAGAYAPHFTGSLVPFAPFSSGASPVVSNFSPALPGPLQVTQTFGFDVTVSDGTPLANISVNVLFTGLGTDEGAYDGAQFSSLYTASTVNPIAFGFRFRFTRQGGLPGRPSAKIRAVTVTGMVNA